MHRDLKLENILINNIDSEKHIEIRIADLGLATLLPENRMNLKRMCGSPSYIAPEIFKGIGYREKCDIFSIGSIFFNLLTGRYLFPGTSDQEVLEQNMICDLKNMSQYIKEADIVIVAEV